MKTRNKYLFQRPKIDSAVRSISGLLQFLAYFSVSPIATFASLLLLPFLAFSQPKPTPHENDSHLKLYFYRSPVGIDWSAPRDLTRSVVKNEGRKQQRSIGHVSVQIDCGHSGESVWTGMSDDSVDFRGLVMKEGYGLGVLFEKVPGSLENREKLEKEFDELARENRIDALDVIISHSTCDRLQTYLEEFKEKGVSKWYGLPNRPRLEEGAGCSAFGVSFLEIGGLMRDEWKTAWARELLVPELWIGGPDTEREVAFKRLYFLRKSLNHWGEHSGDVRSVTFWDPDLMHGWVKQMLENAAPSSGNPDYFILSDGPIPTVVMDARDVPTPDEPFWLEKNDD